MFKTVKSKIIIITLSIFLTLFLSISIFVFDDYRNDKNNRIELCNALSLYYSAQINAKILQIQEKAADLSYMGEHFYKFERNTRGVADFVTRQYLDDEKLKTGGGIWFEPYKIIPSEKRYSAYTFKKSGKVQLDDALNSEKYDYHNQHWYLSIKKNVTPEHNIAWTKPYKDQAGTFSYMTTVGTGIYDENKKLMGVATIDWGMDKIVEELTALRPTPNTLVLFADKKNDVIIALIEKDVDIYKYSGKSLKSIPWYNSSLKSGEFFKYNNKKYISFSYRLDNEMILTVNAPTKELYDDLNKRIAIIFLLYLFTCILITVAIYWILVENLNKPITKLAKFAIETGKGNLDSEIVLDSPEEFARLAKILNKMVKDIKEYIKKLNQMTTEKKEIETELNIAKSIQYSTLPNMFPPYPERSEFDIYAAMYTAKEVGGDFYDFFFIDKNRLAFLTADVSGSGIPAALFMMTTKTLIKNLAQTGMTTSLLMEKINNKIYKTNKEGFFITAFYCVLDIPTGKLTCLNAGHNPPLVRLKKANNKFEYLKTPVNFILGRIANITYETVEITLSPEDCIFLYTDGITEAQNQHKQLYGESRLLNCLNKISDEDISVKNLLNVVKNDVDHFLQGEEQTDDITMTALIYNGFADSKKIVLEAKVDNLSKLINETESFVAKYITDKNIKSNINISVEEIFVNVAHYAYPTGSSGEIEIIFKGKNNKIEIRFIDSGIKYNPLETKEPDTNLNISDRKPGGLGVFMVKNLVNSIEYEYHNGKNILIIQIGENNE